MSASIQDIPEEITALLGLLREQRIRMEQESAKGIKEAVKLQRPLGELANALRALSSEARQWARQVAETMESATPAQKTEVALAWLAGLPVGTRTAAYRTLADMESKSFERLKLSYGD